MTHWLTPDGYNVMLRGLMGDAIKFTRIKYGNGTPGDGANDLKNPLLSLKIASATRSEKYVTHLAGNRGRKSGLYQSQR